MVFERKEGITQEEGEKVQTYFWTLLRWYWLLIPTFYFLFILPKLVKSFDGQSLTMVDISTLFFQILNYVMAGIMFLTDSRERSKKGVGDKFLKIAVVQQFLVQNIFGMIFSLLAWYQLPKNLPAESITEEAEKSTIQPKTTLISVIVTTIFSLIFAIGRIVLL